MKITIQKEASAKDFAAMICHIHGGGGNAVSYDLKYSTIHIGVLVAEVAPDGTTFKIKQESGHYSTLINHDVYLLDSAEAAERKLYELHK